MLKVGSTVQWRWEFWWNTEKHANVSHSLQNMQNISKKNKRVLFSTGLNKLFYIIDVYSYS